MKIIEKIEIRNFRSIKNLDIDFNSSVSIFSGVNSCGKTNILRAMNLFFNDEVGFEKKLSISDFFAEKDKPTSAISIKVYFNSYASDLVKKQKKVPEKFSIKRTFIFRSGFFNQTQKIDGASSQNQERYCENFLKKWVKFHYIPTDRKVFFKKIYNELSEFLGSPFGFKQLKSQFDTMKINFSAIENSLNSRDFVQLNLSKPLKKRLGIASVSYALPEIRNLLKALDFSIKRDTGEKSFVSTEGDGIKFINLLQILDIFDSRYSQESRSRPYVSIWAIDEPENSLEQKNIELFKQEIWDRYSKYKQVFLTSHSPEFLLEPDKPGRNKFYGFENVSGETKEIKEKGSTSSLQFTESEREMLIEKMGVGMTREEKVEFKKQIEKYAKNQKELEKRVRQLKMPVLFVEDKHDQIYKIAWLKLHDINCKKNNFIKKFEIKSKKFTISKSECADELRKTLDLVSTDIWQNKKIVGLFDFDGAYNQFNSLPSSVAGDRRWGKIEGDEISGLYKKRQGGDIYALLLPVPNCRIKYASRQMNGNSKLSIELYFTDDVLKKIGHLGEESVSGVDEKRKIFIGNKAVFWKKLFALPKDNFKHFAPLFTKIEDLFKI